MSDSPLPPTTPSDPRAAMAATVRQRWEGWMTYLGLFVAAICNVLVAWGVHVPNDQVHGILTFLGAHPEIGVCASLALAGYGRLRAEFRHTSRQEFLLDVIHELQADMRVLQIDNATLQPPSSYPTTPHMEGDDRK